MQPSVTVMVPTLNEEEHIGACIASLLDQTYSGDLALLVIDGGSEDATVAICQDSEVEVIDNVHRVQSYALNLGAEYSTSEVLVRADAHSTYAPDYVQTCVDTLKETSAHAVGGPMRAVGVTPTERAIAAAMMSPIAIGPGRFHSETADGTSRHCVSRGFLALAFHRSRRVSTFAVSRGRGCGYVSSVEKGQRRRLFESCDTIVVSASCIYRCSRSPVLSLWRWQG